MRAVGDKGKCVAEVIKLELCRKTKKPCVKNTFIVDHPEECQGVDQGVVLRVQSAPPCKVKRTARYLHLEADKICNEIRRVDIEMMAKKGSLTHAEIRKRDNEVEALCSSLSWKFQPCSLGRTYPAFHLCAFR